MFLVFFAYFDCLCNNFAFWLMLKYCFYMFLQNCSFDDYVVDILEFFIAPKYFIPPEN